MHITSRYKITDWKSTLFHEKSVLLYVYYYGRALIIFNHKNSAGVHDVLVYNISPIQRTEWWHKDVTEYM